MPTGSQVKKAGRTLRRWWESDKEQPSDADVAAWITLLEYRSEFPEPLKRVNLGLRSMVRTEGCPVRVSQRLKRGERIIQKLSRHPNMSLSTMADIGGCRAIVDDLAQLQAVRKRIHKNWVKSIVSEREYLAEPRNTGYRGYHVVVERLGKRVEVQLRTARQHGWAMMVEDAENRTGTLLKDGIGPPEVVDFFRLTSDITWHVETVGGPLPPEMVANADAALRAAREYLVT